MEPMSKPKYYEHVILPVLRAPTPAWFKAVAHVLGNTSLTPKPCPSAKAFPPIIHLTRESLMHLESSAAPLIFRHSP